MLRPTSANSRVTSPIFRLLGSLTKHLMAPAWTAVACLTIGCASQPGPTKASSSEIPEQSASYGKRLNATIKKAPNADIANLARQFFDNGYNASMSDYFTLRDSHIAITKHKACLASVAAVGESDSFPSQAGLSRSALEKLARSCHELSEALSESVKRGLSSGRGPAYEDDRLRLTQRAAELAPESARPLRAVLIESFEEGYQAGLEDRPGGQQGSLDAFEATSIVERECSHVVDPLERDDLRTTICEAAHRIFEKRSSNLPAGRRP